MYKVQGECDYTEMEVLRNHVSSLERLTFACVGYRKMAYGSREPTLCLNTIFQDQIEQI